MTRTLAARTLITAIGTVAYPAIELAADGTIADISTDAGIRSDSTLAPVFVDIHIHGAAGHDVMQPDPAGLERMERLLASRGTGYYLPTTVTAAPDSILRALQFLAARILQGPLPGRATPLGIHLEGPFLSCARRGVHPAELLQPPSVERFTQFQEAAHGTIRLVTLAPELPGALDLIRHCVEHGVRVSLGHTDARRAEAEAALAAGATSATHTFNAMRPLDHREPGVLGTVLDRADCFAELIADGIHVDPVLVRLWLRSKRDRAILVTDGISATGMPDGRYRLGALDVDVRTLPGNSTARCTLVDGEAGAATDTLAGSVLTLDRAVTNLQQFTGCPLAEAVRAASSTPAHMLGLDSTVTSLRVGEAASFNRFSAAGVLEETWLRGERVLN